MSSFFFKYVVSEVILQRRGVISTGHLRVDQQVSRGQSSSPDCVLGHREPICPSGLCSVQAESNAKDIDFCPSTESAFTQQHKPELTERS